MDPVLVLTGTFSGSLAKCLPSLAWVSSAFLPPRPDSFVVRRDRHGPSPKKDGLFTESAQTFKIDKLDSN